MALSDFFRINLPYGIKRNSNNEWVAFNREYKPLGWTDSFNDNFSLDSDDVNPDYPIYTKYKAITEKKLIEIAGSEGKLHYDKEGKIDRVYLYGDGNVPSRNTQTKKDWDDYFDKIKKLSRLIAIR
jgi:hypothetical protein